MTDTEMIKLCAKAREISVYDEDDKCWLKRVYDTTNEACFISSLTVRYEQPYDPLNNNEQAFELVEVLHLDVTRVSANPATDWWQVMHKKSSNVVVSAHNLKRAIVECVAKLQREKDND